MYSDTAPCGLSGLERLINILLNDPQGISDDAWYLIEPMIHIHDFDFGIIDDGRLGEGSRHIPVRVRSSNLEHVRVRDLDHLDRADDLLGGGLLPVPS